MELEKQSRSILVFDIPKEFTEKVLTMYFQKKKHGGGEIRNVTMLLGDEQAIVEFEDKQLLDGLIQKEHIIKGKVVKVSRVMDSENQKKHSDTVLVSNLPKDITENRIKMHFQKKKNLGGDIKNVEFTFGNSQALVTFKEEEVAHAVTQKEQVIAGVCVKTKLFMDEEDRDDRNDDGEIADGAEEIGRQRNRETQPNASRFKGEPTVNVTKGKLLEKKAFNSDKIFVSNLPDNISENKIKIYFQKKKNAGGEITNVEFRSENREALVTFKDPEVARAVANREHAFAGTRVETKLCEKEEEEEEEEEEEKEEEKQQQQQQQQQDYQDEVPEMMELENEKYGQDNLCVQENSRGFERSPLPMRKRQHNIHRLPPGFEKTFVTNDQETGKELKAQRTEEMTTSSEIDEYQQKSSEEQTIPTEMQRTIQVSDIPDGVTETDVLLYFQKKANGGGEVANAKLFPEERKALVVFEEAGVADTVIMKEHFLNGKLVGVERYKPTPEKLQVDYIFPTVTAVINPVLLQKIEREGIKSILDETQSACGIQWHDSAFGMLVTGTLEQIKLAKDFLQQKLHVDCAGQREPAGQWVPDSHSSSQGIKCDLANDVDEGPRNSFGATGEVQSNVISGYERQFTGNQEMKHVSIEELFQGRDNYGRAEDEQKKRRNEKEMNVFPQHQQQQYIPNGQDQLKSKLKTPSSFTEKKKQLQQNSVHSENVFKGDSGENTVDNVPSRQPCTNPSTNKPVPAVRTVKNPPLLDEKGTRNENGNRSPPTTGNAERRKLGPTFNPPKTSENQSGIHSRISKFESPNSLMSFGNDRQSSLVGNQKRNERPEQNKEEVPESKRSEEKSQSLQNKQEDRFDYDETPRHPDSHGQGREHPVPHDQTRERTTSHDQVDLAKYESSENEEIDEKNASASSDHKNREQSVENLPDSFGKMSLDVKQSSTVAHFIQIIYKQDIERFKSQYYVDVVFSDENERFILKPMRGFKQSEMAEAERKIQQLYETTSKKLKIETLDLTKYYNEEREKIKKLMAKQRLDVLVEETINDVFTLVGETGNVELFWKNVFGAIDRETTGSETKSLVDNISLVVNRKGVRVVLMMGEIEKQDCDGIVNFTDNELVHKTGLPYAIREAAGEEFWKECRSIIAKNGPLPDNMVIITKAGVLPCKVVLHAVLAASSKERRQDATRFNLEHICRLLLTKAKETKLKSLCFPIVNPDIANLPIAVSARLLFNVIKTFIETSSTLEGSSLEEIRIVFRKNSKDAEDYKKEFNSQF